MAHLIDTTTGQASVFVAGEPAWHKLGRVVSSAQTSEEAIKLAGLDWQVEKWPLVAQGPTGELPAVPGGFATVRTDTGAVLGTVGGFYRPFQNSECFDFMDALVGERLAMYETAGAIREGRQVWMMARLPKEYLIGGKDDVVLPYVLLTNTHDGTRSLRMIPTSVRVVCNNTLTHAIRKADRAGVKGISIAHFPNLDRKVEEARKALGIIERRLDAAAEEANALAAVKLTTDQAKEYFERVAPRPNDSDEPDAKRRPRADKAHDEMLVAFLDNWHSSRQTDHGTAGTAWAAYNSISEWADHQRKFQGKTQVAKLDNQVNSVWFGHAARLKDRAWEEALTLAS